MSMTTFVCFNDVNGRPLVKVTNLPSLKVGDPITFQLKVSRTKIGRYDVLEVNGIFRTVAVAFEWTPAGLRQQVVVESTGKPPTWKSVKPPLKRPLAPAKSPRTPI